MDALSGILQSFHATGSLLALFQSSGDWGIDFSPSGVSKEHHIVPFQYVVSGQCYLLTEDAPRLLQSDDLVVLPGHAAHSLVSSPESVCQTIYELFEEQGSPIWVPGTTLNRPLLFENFKNPGSKVQILSGVFNLSRPTTMQLLDQLPAVVHIQASEHYLNPQMKAMLEFVLREINSPLPGYAVVAARMVDVLFVQILRLIMQIYPVKAGWLRGVADPRIGLVLAAIHQAPHRQWTVEELGRVGYLSRTSFVNRFSELVGVSPIRYLTDWRMHIAAEALAREGKRISEIAKEVGYPVSQSFTRAFRQAMGQSPQEYRRQAVQKGMGS